MPDQRQETSPVLEGPSPYPLPPSGSPGPQGSRRPYTATAAQTDEPVGLPRPHLHDNFGEDW